MTARPALVENASDVPGQVYLCQISQTTSCGACCGLYNVADASARNLRAMLSYRTRKFDGIRRSADGIYGFQQSIEKRENQRRPFPDFHHCAFIGLIGTERSRVGCLLHPEADGNAGVDYRGLSWYGGMACRSYFCPTHRHLPERFRIAVREVAPDWHLFGLIVTEVNMLARFFNEVEHRLNREIQPGEFLNKPKWRQAMVRFFALKLTWPFRSGNAPGPANYFFEDGQYACPPVRYPDDSAGMSPFNEIFRALRSSFASQKALAAAENLIAQCLLPFS